MEEVEAPLDGEVLLVTVGDALLLGEGLPEGLLVVVGAGLLVVVGCTLLVTEGPLLGEALLSCAAACLLGLVSCSQVT